MLLYLLLSNVFFSLIDKGLVVCDDRENDEYHYVDEDEVNVKKSGGNRLVGARAAKTQQFPFLVGWISNGMEGYIGCTGSLITPRYVISAAHCNGFINQEDTQGNRDACVKMTDAGKEYSGQKGAMLQCKWLPSGDFEIRTNPKSKAYLGVDDININKDQNDQQMTEVRRHIRHAQTYKGGGTYGLYGGHDITLLELERSFPQFKTACLPSPQFDDIRLDKKRYNFGWVW